MEMALAKADARHCGPRTTATSSPQDLQPLGGELRARLARAIAGRARDHRPRELLEDNPVLRRSIDVRNPYVDPINLLQVELLRRLRAVSLPDGAQEDNAMRPICSAARCSSRSTVSRRG